MKKRHISALAAALALLLSLSTANATPLPRGNDPFCDNGDNFKYYTFIDDSKEKTDGDWVFRHRRGQELQPIVDYDAW